MAVMTIGALAGYFLGAHYSQRIEQKRVRRIITAVGFAISGVMFYRQFENPVAYSCGPRGAVHGGRAATN